MTEEMKVQEQLSPIARRAIGKGLRKRVPRSSHGKWALEANRLDPIELRQQQDKNRL